MHGALLFFSVNYSTNAYKVYWSLRKREIVNPAIFLLFSFL